MQEKKNKKSKKITVDKLIFLCLFTTMIVIFLSISKYQSTTAGSDNIKVASPVIMLSSNTLQIKINPIEAEQEYLFQVSNSDEEKRSEVSMKYTLEIKTLSNLPLDFELYQIGSEENLLEGNGNTTKEITMYLNEDEKVINEYRLKIKWREEENSYKFSNVADCVQIVLNSTQVD